MRKARVVVTIRKDVLDPAGVAVKNALQRQGITNLSEVRIGKVVDIMLSGPAAPDEHARIQELAQTLLSNPIMEDVNITMIDERRDEQ